MKRFLIPPLTSSDSAPRMTDSRTALIGSRPGRSAWPAPTRCQSSDQSPTSVAAVHDAVEAPVPADAVDALVDGLVEVDDQLPGAIEELGHGGTVPACGR